MKDFLERDLEIGRFILYPGLSGRSAIMQIGMIRSLNHTATGYGKKKVGIYNEMGYKSNLVYPNRVVQVDDSAIPEGDTKERLLKLRALPPVPLSEA